MTKPAIDLSKLSPNEKFELIDELWESLAPLFRNAVDAAVTRIAEAPLSPAVVYRDLRHVLVRRFSLRHLLSRLSEHSGRGGDRSRAPLPARMATPIHRWLTTLPTNLAASGTPARVGVAPRRLRRCVSSLVLRDALRPHIGANSLRIRMIRGLAAAAVALAGAACSHPNATTDSVPLVSPAAVSAASVPKPYAASASPQPRVVSFPGGRATVAIDGIAEHVVVTGADGHLASESWCPPESGTYDELVTLFERLQVAVASEEAESVARLLRFPFRVNENGARKIDTPGELVSRYHDIFSAPVVEKIRIAQPRALFCRNGSAMLGDGVLWGHAEGGVALADVLNK